jgi:predicted membrane protein
MEGGSNMSRHGRRASFGKLLFGLLVLALGLILTLDNIGVINSGDYLRYWPVILIVIGLAKLLQPSGGKIFGAFLAIFGTLLLLKSLGYIAWSIWALWPIILVLLGLSIIWQALTWRSVHARLQARFATSPPEPGSPEDPDNREDPRTRSHYYAGRRGVYWRVPHASQGDSDSLVDLFVVFGGNERASVSQNFRGGRITAIMGGCDLDLRQASIADGEAVIEVLAFMGGIEIKVPDDWRVIVNVSPLLGGFEDKTRKTGPANKVLVLNGHAIMGGVEIHN